jgi:hypothetical protein
MILNILYDQTCSAKTQHGVHLWFYLYVNKTVNIIYKDFKFSHFLSPLAQQFT